MTPTPATAAQPAPAPAPTWLSRWAPALLWIIPALWSSNYLIARLAQGVVAPHTLAIGRWTLALLLMLPFVGTGLWRRRAAVRAEWRQLLVLGAFGMAICGAWVYIGGHSTSATNIALIYAVAPVAIAVASVRLLHERMRASQRLGLVLALTGVVTIIAKGDIGNLLAVRFAPGDGWVVGATVAWTAYSVLLKRWPSALGPAERLAATIFGGIVCLLPFTLPEWLLTPTPPLGAAALGLIVLAALLPGVISYTAYSLLQREL
ncbi:MAG: DMT family transporter, partial [Rubrivivax sp.]